MNFYDIIYEDFVLAMEEVSSILCKTMFSSQGLYDHEGTTFYIGITCL